ncbi:MAG: histone deacetylase [Pseudomonadota bacterium]
MVFHPDYVAPLRSGHPFPMSKYGYLREVLVERGVIEPGAYLSPAPAPPQILGLAHEQGYVDRVLTQTLRDEEVRRIGLPSTEAVTRRTRLSSAGTLLAARLALENGVACNGAGGSHHARPEGGAGYCVFNDVGVAASTLLAEETIANALVIDLDVHQGDGTARMFADDPRVFTLSLHGAKNFPAIKAASDIDVALPDGLGDDDYLAALEIALERVEDVAADIIFYNAGVDPHADDRLGRLALSDRGLRARDARVLGWAAARAVPIVGVLGGGYGDDPRKIAERHAILFEEAAKIMGG